MAGSACSALTHLAFEVRPQSAERSAEHSSKGWRSEVGQPSASLVGEAPQRVRPVPIGEEAIEQRAVRILRVAAGPVVESTTDAIDRLESGRRCCAPDYLAKVPGIHAALPCLRALLERCNAFDRPQRQRQIGEEHRVSPERPLEAADPSKRSAQVNDVRVLVCEDQPQPVVCVRNRALAVGSGGADLDQVVRDGRGPPVWQVALVHQHNVHAPGCGPERPIERRRDILGYQREPARSFLLALVKVDVEPWCRDRAESKAWVVSRGGESRGGREHDQ